MGRDSGFLHWLGALLVTLQASSGSAGMLLTSRTPSACQVPYLYNILALAD